jgi:hypothetical protein
LNVVGSVIFIVIVGALFVFLLFYGRNGRHDNWLTRPIIWGMPDPADVERICNLARVRFAD